MVEPTLGSAEVAEQADASVSKTDVRKDVRVRLPLSAPRRYETGWTGIRLHTVDIATPRPRHIVGAVDGPRIRLCVCAKGFFDLLKVREHIKLR